MSSLDEYVSKRIRTLMTERHETVRSLAGKAGRSANWLQKRLSNITPWLLSDVTLVGDLMGLHGNQMLISLLQDYEQSSGITQQRTESTVGC